MDKLIKLLLAVLFFICLLDMPYGYFQLVRMVALIGFSILAYLSYEKERNIEVIIFIGLALLFQPFAKVALGREIWNIVDVIVGIGLTLTIIINKNQQE